MSQLEGDINIFILDGFDSDLRNQPLVALVEILEIISIRHVPQYQRFLQVKA